MSEPLRILHAVRSDGFSGVERYIAVLATSQAERGHRVAVVGGDPAEMLRSLGDAPVGFTPATTVWATTRGVDRWRHCDVIHVHMTAAEIAAVGAVRTWQVPVVATRHFGQRRGRSRAGAAVRPLIRARISAEIAVSEYVARHIDAPSTVVHPGVPAAPLVPASDRAKRILVAQRLEPEKHTDVAIRVFAQSGLAAQGWGLDIAGSGSEATALRRLAAGLGVAGAVEILGFRSDVAALMRDHALLLATSPAEHFGLTVVEAMACGLPVIASGAAGHLETVGRASEAALFAPADVPDAARLVRELALDPTRRDRYGAALRDLHVERFSVEAQATAVERVYRSVL